MSEEIPKLQREAELAMANKRWRRAVEIYTRLIVEPGSPAPPESRFTYHLNRGLALRAMGRSKEALEDYLAAAELNPTSWKPHHNRGLIYAQDLQNFSEAVAAFDLALTLNPMDVDSLVARGAARGSAGDSEGSKQDLEAAISLQPDNMEALYNLGNLCLDAGDPAAAAKLYEQAQRVAPFDLAIRKNRSIALARVRSGITNPRAVGIGVQPAMRSDSKPVHARRRGGCVMFVLLIVALYVVWRLWLR